MVSGDSRCRSAIPVVVRSKHVLFADIILPVFCDRTEAGELNYCTSAYNSSPYVVSL